jgi:hypothetical protein
MEAEGFEEGWRRALARRGKGSGKREFPRGGGIGTAGFQRASLCASESGWGGRRSPSERERSENRGSSGREHHGDRRSNPSSRAVIFWRRRATFESFSSSR